MTTEPTTNTNQSDRGRRRTETGVVTSDKMNKTRRVEIPRLVKHARYSKYIRRRTICHVHDESNESKTGDTVEIVESRPFSKTKHWRLLRVVARGGASEDAAAAAAAATAATQPANS